MDDFEKHKELFARIVRILDFVRMWEPRMAKLLTTQNWKEALMLVDELESSAGGMRANINAIAELGYRKRKE